jgi:hypothetical protein
MLLFVAINGGDKMSRAIENDVIVAGGAPLPPNADRCRALTRGIDPARGEQASLGKGIGLCAGGVAALIVIPMAGISSSAFPAFMLLGLAACVVLLALSFRHLIVAPLGTVYDDVHQLMEEHLAPDERILGLCTAKKSGATLWLTGFSKQSILVFTTHRVFLLGFKSMVSSFKSAFRDPAENIQVMSCDLGDPARVQVGGILVPPGLHLFARRIDLRPEGRDESISWAAFVRFGANGRVIRSILDRRSGLALQTSALGAAS